jgi:hypothetical protein
VWKSGERRHDAAIAVRLFQPALTRTGESGNGGFVPKRLGRLGAACARAGGLCRGANGRRLILTAKLGRSPDDARPRTRVERHPIGVRTGQARQQRGKEEQQLQRRSLRCSHSNAGGIGPIKTREAPAGGALNVGVRVAEGGEEDFLTQRREGAKKYTKKAPSPAAQRQSNSGRD